MNKDLRHLDEQQQNISRRLNDVSKDGAQFRYTQRENWKENQMSKLQGDDMDVEPKLSHAVFDPSENRTRQQEVARREEREYRALMKNITFNNEEEGWTYQDVKLKPGSYLMEHLVKQQKTGIFHDVGFDPDDKNVITSTKMKVRIPPSYVAGFTEHPYMFFTDTHGYLCRCDNVSSKVFKHTIGVKSRDSGIPGLDTSKSKDDGSANAPPVTVIKRPKYTGNCNDIHLLNQRQTNINTMSGAQAQIAIIQKYLRCKGPAAAITRFVWTAGKGSYAYQISNKIKVDDWQKEKDSMKRLLASSEFPGSLTVFTMKGKALKELEQMTTDIVLYLTNTVKPKPVFKNMVCDFIKDQQGVWWYIQTKAFRLMRDTVPHSVGDLGASQTLNSTAHSAQYGFNESHVTTASHKKKKGKTVLRMMNCAICGAPYRPADLQYSLTLKMIYATERHLKKHGEHRPWFDRQEFRVAENPLWYQPKRVCKSCFDMYIHEQKLEQAELLFAKAIGIPIDSNQMEISNVLAAYNRRRNQLKAQTGARTYDPNTFANMLTHEGGSTPHSPPGSPARSFKGSSPRARVPRCAHVGIRSPQIQHSATTLRMYRLVMFFYEIHNIPETIEGPLYLKLDFLYTTLKLPIYASEQDKGSAAVPLNKLRVFHFFTNAWDENAPSSANNSPSTALPGSPSLSGSPAGSPTGPASPTSPLNNTATGADQKSAPVNPHLKSFMQAQGELVIHLWQPSPVGSLGQCRLPLSQFEGGLIEKLDYVRLFSTTYSQLCSLRVTLGIIKGRDVPVDDIALKQHPTGVWVPSEDFFCVDALPDEWMQLVIGKQQETETVGAAGKYVLAADAMLTEANDSKVEEILCASPTGTGGNRSGRRGKNALKETFEGWKASWATEERYGSKKAHSNSNKKGGRQGGKGMLAGGTYSQLQNNNTGAHMNSKPSSPIFVKRAKGLPNRTTTDRSKEAPILDALPKRTASSVDNLRNAVNASKTLHVSDIKDDEPSSTKPSFSAQRRRTGSGSGGVPVEGRGRGESLSQDSSHSNSAHVLKEKGETATVGSAGSVSSGHGGMGMKRQSLVAKDDKKDEKHQQFAHLTAIAISGRADSNNQIDDYIPSHYVDRLVGVQAPCHVWCMHLHIQTITDLGSAVDESWVISYNLLGKNIIHESFQLFHLGPLVFDVEDFFYVYSWDPLNFVKYLKSVNKIKVVLSRKYNFMIVKEAEVSLMQLVNDANSGSSKDEWTGSSMHGLFPMSTRATLQIEKDTSSQHGSSTGMASYQSDEDSPQRKRKGRKSKNKKRRGSSGSKNMRVFQLTNDEYDDNDDEELFFVESEAGRKEDMESEDDSGSDLNLSPSVSHSNVHRNGVDDGSESESSQSDGSSDEQDEQNKRPQLALVVKLSKPYMHTPLVKAASGVMHTDHGPLVILNSIQ
eukprot:TRINITY_DN59382_c0_g1_i1.p1 TRINITY_DN59382_c0_g1~~TRINITY_DN59382_c0_g1_i1.p1  ORF type:complete len:1420 (+),score=179.98 TRINITY_DN59382_c0_g1_i1:23-4282(+)